MRARRLWFLLVTIAACGDSSNDGTSEPRVCVAHNAPEPAALSTPAASFETDVAPVLEKSCAFSSCHGSRGPANRGIFLGAKTAEDRQAVKDALRSVSRAAPTLPYVTPGDPDKSFLMHKLDGTQLSVGGTGVQMPYFATPLSQADRDGIRAWINSGAPQN